MKTEFFGMFAGNNITKNRPNHRMNAMQTILATTSSFGKSNLQALKLLRDAGFNVVTNPFGRKLTKQELSRLLKKHRPVGLLAGTEPVTGSVLETASDYLKAVARVGVGWDNVDHETAKRLGIPVSRTEGVLDQAVAELTLGMILDALRNISRHDREMRSGIWKKHLGSLLSGKTVGVIGFGAIGRKVAELCRAFGANIVFSDIVSLDVFEGEQLGLYDLLSRADIVTIHASGNTCLLGKQELKRCRRGVVLVNTARGGLIDEVSLATALAEGAVGYACLDVFEKEPYTGPFSILPNTVLTTHVGSYAAEARQVMELTAARNILDSLKGAV